MFWRRGPERDLERELRNHLELEMEERGDLYAARRVLGNLALIKEETRDTWALAWIDRLLQDGRYALRSLRRKPAFAFTATVSLAIALGANTAVFSFVNAIVLKTLPVAGARRLVIVRQNNEQFHIENCCFKYDFFQELRKQETDFEDALAVNVYEVNLTAEDRSDKESAEVVSGNYFHMLGVGAAAGRLLDERDDGAEGAAPVCVISHHLWQERFGARADTIGQTVLINALPFQIVGVTEPGFFGAALHGSSDLQIPSAMLMQLTGNSRDQTGWAQIIARLRPDVRVEQAQARLNVLGRNVQRITGPKMAARDDFYLRDGTQGIGSRKDQFGSPVVILMLLVGVVLLVACANLSALLLVRSVERTREAGLRIAIGASRGAMYRHVLAESVMIAMFAAAAGWLLARLLIGVLLNLLGASGEALTPHIQTGGLVFAFSTGIALATGLLFGILPGWRAAHADPLPAIRGTPFVNSGRRRCLSAVVIAGQIALSVVLVFSSGLFMRTLNNLRSIYLGFQPEHVAIVAIDLSRTVYKNNPEPYFDDLLHRASSLPETRAASLASLSILSGSLSAVVLEIPGYVRANGAPPPITNLMKISSGYFQTLGIPLLAGRDFTSQDRATGREEGVAIVNQEFARQFLRAETAEAALYKVFRSTGRSLRVVGVAANTKYRFVREQTQPVLYIPAAQGAFPGHFMVQVRTAGDPGRLLTQLRALAQSTQVPVDHVETMEMQLDQALARERLLAFLSTLLATVATALAGVGLYGVLRVLATRRSREIGIRLAVGARRRQIMLLVLGQSGWMVIAGVTMGVPLALASGRLASSLLYGVKPQDPSTVAGACLLLAVIAFTASLWPAFRAARTDPMAALRSE